MPRFCTIQIRKELMIRAVFKYKRTDLRYSPCVKGSTLKKMLTSILPVPASERKAKRKRKPQPYVKTQSESIVDTR